MSITATVEEEGRITLPADLGWPAGAVVKIELVEEELPTLYEALKEFDGIVDDMPSDLAENHDHYVHGLPRK